MRGLGGYGGIDRDLLYLSPDNILDSIMDEPGHSGYSAPFGMITKTGVVRSALEERSKGRFLIRDWNLSYWILEGKDYYEVFNDYIRTVA